MSKDKKTCDECVCRWVCAHKEKAARLVEDMPTDSVGDIFECVYSAMGEACNEYREDP
ncbi:hypothetical protein KAR91_13920 [Candidatus Pacearchaeota archaeon]|nr:hypothetical protein [Candidatus Pacearchaeota archaeon]